MTDSHLTDSRPIAVVSMSGGKDSTATALLALEQPGLDVRVVFADTGHEHDETYRYVREYLPSALGVPVDEVKADFAPQIARKRDYIQAKWAEKGVPRERIEAALQSLHPTGVPFLDLCLWKGRFPSRMAQFCTQELKRRPLDDYMFALMESERAVESWRGIRRDESRNRADVAEREKAAEGWTVVHPIATWTAAQTVAYIQSKGLRLNPLYEAGMTRVGCMPCINCRKDELLEIALRYPAEVERVREWERLVSEASRRGAATFFTDGAEDGETVQETAARSSIDAHVQWARTGRGGKQLDMFRDEPRLACSSVYGLCE
jgi:3'-phosphoadenosine 5'-phosphosulfate sulfotransferase (PAPS reductase)/FAD synthetase